VTDMSRMFEGAASFNQPLSSWEMQPVVDMCGMFHRATSFRQSTPVRATGGPRNGNGRS
jgi:hypothetical protein